MHSPMQNVFVSSTWLDLRPERAIILEVTQRFKQLKFLGMEYFGSRNEGTCQASIDEVDQSQLYVGVVGGRYGSGITEQEYLRARERGIPCLIYFKSEKAIEKVSTEASPEGQQRLTEFKHRLHQQHTCSEFNTPEELAFKIAADLHNWLFGEHLNHGLSKLSTDYAARVQGFVSEYVGGSDRHVPFGGRNLEIQELNNWLTDPASPKYFLVAAGAGRGKSALLVNWTRDLLTRNDVTVLFFPISIRFRTNLESVVFASLASYLATVHGEQLSLTPDTPPEVFRNQVADYLTRPLADGRQLLLVLDGLDEAADWSAGPDLFPPQSNLCTRVVVSARFLAGDANTHDWLRRLGWDTTGLAETLELSPLTERGVADVLKNMGFPLRELGSHIDIVNELYRLSEGDPLLVRLYVDDLWNRGEEAVRLQVKDLQTIRPGLEGFFARWWDDQRKLWGSTSHPLRETRVQAVLNYLAGALGPLSRDDLLSIANPEVDLTTWTLEDALEPLSRFITGDGVKHGYVYSHPRLGIYFLERLSNTERKAINQRILKWCAECLHTSNIKEQCTEKISPYVVQYFGAHLERSNADLDQLELLLSDGWRKAWLDYEGTYAGFRTDVRRVWRAAERVHKTEAYEERTPSKLALEVRCALCITSVDQLSENTPPELIGALLKKSVWPTTAALGYARLVHDPERRARALLCLGDSIPEQTKNKMLQEALEAISMIDDEATQVSLLQSAAPQISTPVVPQAMSITLKLSQKKYMVEALLYLAPHLSPSHVEQAVQAARKLNDDELRSEFLRTIATTHPNLLLEGLHNSLRETDAWERTWILLGASNGLSGDTKKEVLADALNTAQTVDVQSNRLDLALLVISQLEPATQAALAQDLVSEVLNLSLPLQKAKLLSRLTELVSEEKREEVCQAAIQAINNITAETWRAKCLSWLAPGLNNAQQATVLTIATKIEDESVQAQALAALVPHLNVELRQHAISLLCDIDDPLERALGAAQVAEFVPETIYEKIINIFSEEELSSTWRFSLLRSFAPHLNASQLDYLASTSSNIYGLGELATYAALAPFSSSVWKQFINFLRPSKFDLWYILEEEGGQYLTELAQCADEHTKTHIANSILAWPNNATKVKLMQCFAAHLSTPLLKRFAEQIFSWDDKTQKLEAVRTLADYSPAPLLVRMLQEVQVIGDDTTKQQLQLAGLKMLPLQKVKIAPTWKTLSNVDRVWLLIEWIDETGQQPSDCDITEIVGLLGAIEDNAKRAEAISGLIKQFGDALQIDDISNILNIILSLPPEYYTANALAKITPYLSESLLNQNLPALLQAALHPSPADITLLTDVTSRVSDSLFLTTAINIFDTELERIPLLENDEANRVAYRLVGLVNIVEKLPNTFRTNAIQHLQSKLSDMLETQQLTVFKELLLTDESLQITLETCLSLARAPNDDSRSLLTLLMFIEHMKQSLTLELVPELIDLTIMLPDNKRLAALTKVLQGAPRAIAESGLWDTSIRMHCLPKLQKEDRNLTIHNILKSVSALSGRELEAEVYEYLFPYATDDLYQSLAMEVLADVRASINMTIRAQRLCNMIPYLHAETLEEAATEATELLQKYRTLLTEASWQESELEYHLSELLAELLPRVSAERTLQLLKSFFSGYCTVNILMALIHYTPIKALASACSEVLQTIQNMNSADSIANTVRALGERLGPETPKKLIKAIEEQENPTFRAITCVHVLPNLSTTHFKNAETIALAAATEISDIAERTVVLQAMLEIYHWPELAKFALSSIEMLQKPSKIIRACIDLLPHLKPPHNCECATLALLTLKKIEDEYKRAGFLQQLSSVLPDESFETAIGLLTELSDPVLASRAGVTLLQHSPPIYAQQLFTTVTRSSEWISDERALHIMAERIIDPEIAKVFHETLESVQPQFRKVPNALLVLSPYLKWFCKHTQASPRFYYPLWHDLLVLATTNKRAHLLDTIRELLPVTETLGGLDSIENISTSVAEITTWWP